MDRSILLLNIILLMTIVVLPFTTALMARYLLEEEGHTLAALLYGASLLVTSLVFFAFNWHLLTNRAPLLRNDISPAYRRSVLRRNLLGVLPYGVATLGALVTPYITLAICPVVAVYFLLPFTTPESAQTPSPPSLS